MKQSKPEWPEKKTVCGNQSYFAVGENENSLLFLQRSLPADRKRGRTINHLHVQSQEPEILTFCLGAASKVLPSPLVLSQAGLIASISEEVVEHPAASCLMKQAAVVIKKTLYLHANLGMAPIVALFYLLKGHACYVSRMVRKPWPSASKVTQRCGDLAKALARIAAPSTNTVQGSAIFFSAL